MKYISLLHFILAAAVVSFEPGMPSFKVTHFKQLFAIGPEPTDESLLRADKDFESDFSATRPSRRLEVNGPKSGKEKGTGVDERNSEDDDDFARKPEPTLLAAQPKDKQGQDQPDQAGDKSSVTINSTSLANASGDKTSPETTEKANGGLSVEPKSAGQLKLAEQSGQTESRDSLPIKLETTANNPSEKQANQVQGKNTEPSNSQEKQKALETLFAKHLQASKGDANTAKNNAHGVKKAQDAYNDEIKLRAYYEPGSGKIFGAKPKQKITLGEQKVQQIGHLEPQKHFAELDADKNIKTLPIKGNKQESRGRQQDFGLSANEFEIYSKNPPADAHTSKQQILTKLDAELAENGAGDKLNNGRPGGERAKTQPDATLAAASKAVQQAAQDAQAIQVDAGKKPQGTNRVEINSLEGTQSVNAAATRISAEHAEDIKAKQKQEEVKTVGHQQMLAKKATHRDKLLGMPGTVIPREGGGSEDAGQLRVVIVPCNPFSSATIKGILAALLFIALL